MIAFSALTLLVGHQKEHPACKNWLVICLERGADCMHKVQLMPLPSKNPIISCLIEIQTGFAFWNWLTQVELEKRPLNRCSVGVICLCFVLTISKPLAEYHANNIGLHHTRNVPVGCCLSKWFFEGVQWTERTALGLVCRAVIPVLLFWEKRSSCIQWLMQEHFYLGLWNRSAL